MSILRELVARLGEQPEEALPHARAWAALDAYDLEARLATMRMAHAAGHEAEAEQYFSAGRRILAEVSDPRERQLVAAWAELRRSPAPTRRNTASAAERAEPAPVVTPAPTPVDRVGGGAPADGTTPRGARGAALSVSADHETSATSTSLPLVGRHRELSMLTAAVDEAKRQQQARILVMQGEPGIGKSRLVEALREHTQRSGGAVVYASAQEGEAGRPYGPWIDALRRVAHGADRDAGANGALEALLPDAHTDATDAGGRDRLLAGVADFVRGRAAREQVLLLAFDDVQWLDPASAELLHYVLRQCQDCRLVLLLAARRDELPDNVALARVIRSLGREGQLTTLPLERLDRAALEALLPDCPALWDRVYARSGGNPLFALQLARSTSATDEALPLSVTETVRERVLRIGPEAADVLRWAAVLGESFHSAQLESLIDLDPGALVSALELLEAQALLVADEDAGAFTFVHGVVRQAVYGDLSRARSRYMHRRVAELLRDQGRTDSAAVAELARHANLCGDAQLAADACARAGERCLRVFANRQAATLAQRGLRHARTLPDEQRVGATIRLMGVELRARRPEDRAPVKAELEALAQEALSLGQVPEARRAFWLLSYLFWEDGSGAAANRYMREAERISQSLEPRARVESMADSGRCLLLLEHDLGEGSALLFEADARAKVLEVDLANIQDGLGMIAQHQGDYTRAAECYEQAYTLAQLRGEHAMAFYATEHALMLEVERADLGRAARHLSRAEQLAPKLRDGSEAPYVVALAGLLRHLRGEVDPGALDDQLAPLRMADAKARLAFILSRAAQVDLSRGDLAHAIARATSALDLAEILERPSEIALSSRILQRAHAARGDTAEADRHAAEALRRGSRDVSHGVLDYLQRDGEGVPSAGPDQPPATTKKSRRARPREPRA
ncbi:MAG: AAA family ATPase [Sandaracinaceae bacterium]|nr:AAA family ATPase [Sandaracinaceae bacterium]